MTLEVLQYSCRYSHRQRKDRILESGHAYLEGCSKRYSVPGWSQCDGILSPLVLDRDCDAKSDRLTTGSRY